MNKPTLCRRKPETFTAIQIQVDNLQEVLNFLGDEYNPIWKTDRVGVIGIHCDEPWLDAERGNIVCKYEDGHLRVFTQEMFENIFEPVP